MNEVLEVAGCLAAAGALSVSFLASEPRLRAAALVLAGALAFALIAGQGWDELRTLRDHPPEFAGRDPGRDRRPRGRRGGDAALADPAAGCF